MNECLYELEAKPSLRKKVMGQVETLVEKVGEEKGRVGTMNGQKIRQRLAKERRLREAATEKDLEDMIQSTAQTNAIQAINLSNLLRKKWTEDKDAYVILSKIKTYKQKERLNNMNSNRYIVWSLILSIN